MVCDKVIRPKRIEIDMRREEVRVDHEHEYVVFIEDGVAIPLNRKTAQLLKTLNRIRYIESSV